MSTVLTEKSLQRLQDCRCDVISADPLSRTLVCSYKEAKSLMLLTNNVFYKKRKGNQAVLVAKTEEILEVIRKVIANGGTIPKKEYLEYPRNLICILFCGTVPHWVKEQDVLQAVSRLDSKSKILVESPYSERVPKKQVQREFGFNRDRFKTLEQSSLTNLLLSLERVAKERGCCCVGS